MRTVFYFFAFEKSHIHSIFRSNRIERKKIDSEEREKHYYLLSVVLSWLFNVLFFSPSYLDAAPFVAQRDKLWLTMPASLLNDSGYVTSLLMCLGREQKMTQVLGTLPPMLKTQIKLLASGSGLLLRPIGE